MNIEVQKWEHAIGAVHPWLAAAAIGATQVNEAENANDAGVRLTGYEAQKGANVRFVVPVEGRWVEKRVPHEQVSKLQTSTELS